MEEHPAKSCWLNANRMSVKSKERDRFVPYLAFSAKSAKCMIKSYLKKGMSKKMARSKKNF